MIVGGYNDGYVQYDGEYVWRNDFVKYTIHRINYFSLSMDS